MCVQNLKLEQYEKNLISVEKDVSVRNVAVLVMVMALKRAPRVSPCRLLLCAAAHCYNIAEQFSYKCGTGLGCLSYASA